MSAMSNRDSDARYEHLQQGVPFFGDELLKRVHTSLPGVVVSYDAATRRARVQPAVDHLVSPEGNPNAEFGDLEPMPNPIILDVPVMHSDWRRIHRAFTAGCRRYRSTCCLPNGISQRSNRRCAPARRRPMTLWKSSTPLRFPVLATPMWPFALAGAGLVLQTSDGATFVELTAGNVSITATQTLTLRAMWISAAIWT